MKTISVFFLISRPSPVTCAVSAVCRESLKRTAAYIPAISTCWMNTGWGISTKIRFLTFLNMNVQNASSKIRKTSATHAGNVRTTPFAGADAEGPVFLNLMGKPTAVISAKATGCFLIKRENGSLKLRNI